VVAEGLVCLAELLAVLHDVGRVVHLLFGDRHLQVIRTDPDPPTGTNVK
jgi:hypothetical protein